MIFLNKNSAKSATSLYLDALLSTKQESSHIAAITQQPPLPYMNFLHSYRVVIENEAGKKYFGLGSDRDITLAIIKAANEAIGKFCIDESGMSEKSNGLAVHTSERLAKETALLELIERDQFLVSWLTASVPFRINIWSLPQKMFKKIFSQIESVGHDIYVFGFSNDIPVHVLGVLIITQKNEVCFGLAADWSFEQSIEKAVVEALRWLGYKQENPGGGPSTDFGRESFLIMNDSIAYSKYIDSQKWIVCLEDLEVTLASKKISYFKLDAGPFNKMTHVIKAMSTHLQDLFFGQPSEAQINNKRLAELGLKWINRSPHPLN